MAGAMEEEARYLDNIEDAKEELAHYQKLLSLAIGVLSLGGAMIVAGAVIGVVSGFFHVDLGGLVVLLVLGGIVVGGAGGGGCVYVTDATDGPQLKRKARDAERAYRDYINRQVRS